MNQIMVRYTRFLLKDASIKSEAQATDDFVVRLSQREVVQIDGLFL